MGRYYPGPIGAVQRWLIDPCMPSWQILAHSAEHALAAAFITFIEPNFKGSYKNIVGHSWLHQAKMVISDASKAEESLGGDAVRMAFSFTEFADKLSWWVFLGDLAGETLFNFTSMVIEGTQCHTSPHIQRWSSRSPYLPIVLDGNWWNNPHWANNEIPPYSDFSMGLSVPPGGYGQIAFGIQYNGYDTDILPLSARVVQTATGRVYDAYTMSGRLDDAGNHAAIVWAKVHNPTTEAFEIQGQIRSDLIKNDIRGPKQGFCHMTLFTP